jgi:hypothetical protein
MEQRSNGRGDAYAAAVARGVVLSVCGRCGAYVVPDGAGGWIDHLDFAQCWDGAGAHAQRPCPGRMRWQRLDHTGPVVCDLCHAQDHEQHESDPCRAGVRPGLQTIYACPDCHSRSRTPGWCDAEGCGSVREARYSYRAVQYCGRCERGPFFADEGSDVVTSWGDRLSPPEGYWLCDTCADYLQAQYEAAQAEAEERREDEYDYRGLRGQNPHEDH